MVNPVSENDVAGTAAIDEAKKAGVMSPAEIAATDPADPMSVNERLIRCEAMLAHIFAANYRNVDIDALVHAWKNPGENKVLDPTAQGRA
jgi:hypothetical protein